MVKSTYDIINEYCTSKYENILVQAERDFVLRKFLDSYYEALEAHRKSNNGTEPTPEQEGTIINSLLNESTLHSYADSAQNYYQKFTGKIVEDYKKNIGGFSFWKSVGTSVVANILYSIILIFIFFIAKNQIATWLTQLAG